MEAGGPLQVRAGRPLRLRVLLSSFQGTAGSPTVELTLRIPDVPPGSVARLVVRGGSTGGGEEPGSPTQEPGRGSFAGLVAALQNEPRNDELLAELLVEEGPKPGGEPAVSTRQRLDEVVTRSTEAAVGDRGVGGAVMLVDR